MPVWEPVWFSLGWVQGGSLDDRLGSDMGQGGGARPRLEY